MSRLPALTSCETVCKRSSVHFNTYYGDSFGIKTANEIERLQFFYISKFIKFIIIIAEHRPSVSFLHLILLSAVFLASHQLVSLLFSRATVSLTPICCHMFTSFGQIVLITMFCIAFIVYYRILKTLVFHNPSEFNIDSRYQKIQKKKVSCLHKYENQNGEEKEGEREIVGGGISKEVRNFIFFWS